MGTILPLIASTVFLSFAEGLKQFVFYSPNSPVILSSQIFALPAAFACG